jgi:hypothetical protein
MQCLILIFVAPESARVQRERLAVVESSQIIALVISSTTPQDQIDGTADRGQLRFERASCELAVPH